MLPDFARWLGSSELSCRHLRGDAHPGLPPTPPATSHATSSDVAKLYRSLAPAGLTAAATAAQLGSIQAGQRTQAVPPGGSFLPSGHQDDDQKEHHRKHAAGFGRVARQFNASDDRKCRSENLQKAVRSVLTTSVKGIQPAIARTSSCKDRGSCVPTDSPSCRVASL